MVDFSAVNLDSKLAKIGSFFDKHLKISNKGFFVFLATYALKNQDKIDKYLERIYDNKGSQFRSETDTIYNPYIIILVTKYIKLKELGEISDFLEDSTKFKKVLESLVNFGNAAGYYLLDNNLASYKNNLTDINIPYFIYDVLFIMQSLEDEDIF